jgi:asparagine synthase (glutamine-hydrolysing)
MCGIAGILYKNEEKRSWAQETIIGMMNSMAHRGPDGRDIYVNDLIVFGHLRLAIIDLENGKQPITSIDGNFVLIFNGEIYNYLELRKGLLGKGYRFKTNSDSEVLLNLYIEYGEKMLDFLNGMFAFAIHDIRTGKTFLARDHFGIKPLYYYESDDFFAFASEIKALVQIPEVKIQVNEEVMHEYVTFQFTLSNRTLYDSIKKLEPAHYIYLGDNKIIEYKRYWQLDYSINEHKSESEFADELLILLNNAISLQVRSDVQVGVYLSGGIDSSTIALLASKHFYEPLNCFTGAFRESIEYDETKYANIIIRRIDGISRVVYPEWTDFVSNFEQLIWLMDEPAAGPGLFSQYMVSKLASEHVKVVLGGQGADEIFGGYMRYNIAYLEQCLKGAIFDTAEEGKHVLTLESMVSNLSNLKNYTSLIKQHFSSGIFDPMDRRYFNLINRAHQAEKYYSSEFLKSFDTKLLFEKFALMFNDPNTPSMLNKMTNFDIRTFLPALLQVEDRVSMGNSIESRVPFLDKHIAELTASIPPNMKFNGGINKNILLKTIKNILPKEILNRKDKMGFPTPINDWLSGPAREYAMDILSSHRARQRGYINTNFLDNIDKDFKFSRDIWGAMCIETWFRKNIDNQGKN